MASKWFPSVCKQYRVLSWGSSHSMTHFLSRKRRCGGSFRVPSTSTPDLPFWLGGREAESPHSLKPALMGKSLLSKGLFLTKPQPPG